MRNTKDFIDNLFELDPTTVICLYNVSLKEKGEYLFHAGENGYRKSIIFGGKEYEFFPITVEGFDVHGNGKLARPKMTIGNQHGVISLRLNYFKDFSNHKVTRVKTFLKYLDHENFPKQINPYTDPDPDVTYSEDVYYVNQKTIENDDVVEFELVSLLELQTAKIPNRKIYSNHCSWVYRSKNGCGYTGAPISDIFNKKFVNLGYSKMSVGSEFYMDSEEELSNDIEEWSHDRVYNKGDVVKVTPFDQDDEINPEIVFVCISNDTESYPVRDRVNWVEDNCDKTLCGCKLRFSDDAKNSGGCQRNGEEWTEFNNGLPFGGFPGVERYEAR
jgi:lambda family phage minor tail protein L